MLAQNCALNDSIFTLVHADSVPGLSKAAAAGDLENLRKLLSRGSLPQTPDNRGWTAIHCCVAANQIQALKLILKLKSQSKRYLVNLTTWENITPLLIALKAERPSLKMVKVLLKAGADPKLHTYTKLSPLHLACTKKGNIDIVKLLVQYGADINLQEDLSLYTPLHFAVCEGFDLEITKFLINLSDLSLNNVYERTAFVEAVNSNFSEAVQAFLEKDKNLAISKSVVPPVVYACVLGNLKTVELLINSGADVNSRCKALLTLKSIDSELTLLNKENFLPIHSSLKNIDVFKFLLKLTDANNLLQLETSFCNFSLFVIVYGDEDFLEALLESDFPDELKTFNSELLIKFILSYADIKEMVAKKFPLIFKYNFTLNPEKFFEKFFSQMSKEGLNKHFKILSVLSKMGISSSIDLQIKNCILNFLDCCMLECAGTKSLNSVKTTRDLLSSSVLTLKQYCRAILRHHIRSFVENDWLAVKMISESNLPDCVKKFLFYEVLN